ncbi:hypothetical protein FSW04_12310 [Baekduia soli]|uniref:Uncharacterized protein n=1 Tax=Baekduia soli TaxID=496014 RepID=A0A5B8U6I6_9ACTN|nr:hypothetical protein [Baekduia soli]QEC48272.1 hypothetical protein FSW04_12310 [Baekduia soli]
MGLRSLLPRGRALIVVDVLLVAWVVLWIVMGGAVAGQVRGLRQLSGTAAQIGTALRETGQAVETLSNVPFVGDRVAGAGRQIDAAGVSTIESARASRSSIHTLSWMLWVFLAVIPTVPVLVLYLPLRVLVVRERRALRRLVAERGHDPVLRRLLAQRALLTMPYHRLLAQGDDPFDDARGPRMDELADAELARLGVRPASDER